MAVVNERISEAEERFETTVGEINKQTSETIQGVITAANDRKEAVLEECIDSVLN